MKLPLTQGSYTARSIIANAQRCVNLYPEKNTPDAVFPYTLYPRPGYSSLYEMGAAAGAPRCNYVASNGDLFRVIGASVYHVSSIFVHTEIGTITAGSAPVYMADNGLAVLIVDGTSNGYCIDLTSGSYTFGAVNDAAFYGADRVDYVDTYFLLNRPGTNQFYISLSAVSYANLTGTISPDQLYAAFDPLDIAAKTGWPDPLSGLIVLRREVWLIGEKTTEVWFNSGDSNFTFQEMPGVFVEHGCIAPYSIWKQDVSIYWLGQDKEGRAIVIEGTQYAAKRISTHAIENEFAGYASLSDAVGGIYQVEGHIFYKLTFPIDNKTWMYDVASGFWFEDVYTDSNGNENRSLGIFPVNAYGENIESSRTTGDLLKIDLDSFVDVGVPIVRRRGFPHLMSDGGRVSYPSFIADVSVGDLTQSVQSITVDAAGSGYTSAPTVAITEGGGIGAAAVANMSFVVGGVSLAAGGSGYTSIPTVSLVSTGPGSGATAVPTVSAAVASVTLTAPGSGYTSAPTVNFSGGAGTGATATASIDQGVTGLAIATAGSGYASAPTVAFSGGGGSGAAATFSLVNGTVVSVAVTNGGVGYTSAPTVSFSGGGGSGATATATVGTGTISGWSVSFPGSYSSVPSVSFSGGGGSGASATAITTPNIYSIAVTSTGSGYTYASLSVTDAHGSIIPVNLVPTISGGQITAVTILNPGATSGATAPFSVYVNVGDGTGFAASTTTGYGVLGLTITSVGSGYTSAPTVSFGGTYASQAISTVTVNSGLLSLTLTAGGSGYTSTPTVNLAGGGGSGASATATISAEVGSATIASAGTGYTSAPTATISGGGGSGATATATISGPVSNLKLTSPGTGYTSDPTISFTGGGGTGAAATALSSQTIVGITLTAAGSGYIESPNVIITGGGGSGASAIATLSGSVSSISVVDAGVNYTSAPTISLTGGGGTGATATAVIGYTVPKINLRWSDTRGQTWGNALEQSLGLAGQYYTQPQWNRLGYGRDRVFELYWSSPTKTALNGAWIEMIPFGS